MGGFQLFCLEAVKKCYSMIGNVRVDSPDEGVTSVLHQYHWSRLFAGDVFNDPRISSVIGPTLSLGSFGVYQSILLGVLCLLCVNDVTTGFGAPGS